MQEHDMWRFAYFDKRANEIYLLSMRMNVDWTRTGQSADVSVVVNAAIQNCITIHCSSEARLRHERYRHLFGHSAAYTAVILDMSQIKVNVLIFARIQKTY